MKTLEEEGKDAFKEMIKMEGIQEQMQEEAVKVNATRVELGEAEAAMASLTRHLQTSQLQFNTLAAKKFQLKAGRSTLNFLPWPMVYSPKDLPLPSRDLWDESKFLRIIACSLCSFPFPQNDIVVSSCKHLYHPFCASVVFSRNSKCMVEGCQDFSHPEWHRSFGWGERDAELSERELTLGLAKERRRIMKERIEEARSRLPAISKFTFQYSTHAMSSDSDCVHDYTPVVSVFRVSTSYLDRVIMFYAYVLCTLVLVHVVYQITRGFLYSQMS